MEAGRGGDDEDAVGELPGFEVAYCSLGGVGGEAGVGDDGADGDDAVA